jgi:hypothetical protein
VPTLEARAQTRLAGLSSDSVHVLDQGIGHFVPAKDPAIVVAAARAVVEAVRSGRGLAPCVSVFARNPSARCIARGQLAPQTT